MSKKQNLKVLRNKEHEGGSHVASPAKTSAVSTRSHSSSINSASRQMKSIFAAWNSFWFEDRSHQEIARIRTCIGIASAIYALTWIPLLGDLIDDDGLLSRTQVEFLIGRGIPGTGSEGRVSPLFSLIPPNFAWSYALATSLLASLVAIGIGGRVMAVLAWLFLLGLVHRVPMVQGAGDFLLTGLFGYLAICPGRISWRLPHTIAASDGRSSWFCNMTFRLIQCHIFIWFGASMASHFAEQMWWNADAPWWLSFSGDRSWVPMQFWLEHPYVMNLIVYSIAALHILILFAFVFPVRGFIGFAAMIALSAAIFVIANDWLYGLAIVACSTIFVSADPKLTRQTKASVDLTSLEESLKLGALAKAESNL